MLTAPPCCWGLGQEEPEPVQNQSRDRTAAAFLQGYSQRCTDGPTWYQLWYQLISGTDITADIRLWLCVYSNHPWMDVINLWLKLTVSAGQQGAVPGHYRLTTHPEMWVSCFLLFRLLKDVRHQQKIFFSLVDLMKFIFPVGFFFLVLIETTWSPLINLLVLQPEAWTWPAANWVFGVSPSSRWVPENIQLYFDF